MEYYLSGIFVFYGHGRFLSLPVLGINYGIQHDRKIADSHITNRDIYMALSLSHTPSKSGIVGSIPGLSCLSDDTEVPYSYYFEWDIKQEIN